MDRVYPWAWWRKNRYTTQPVAFKRNILDRTHDTVLLRQMFTWHMIFKKKTRIHFHKIANPLGCLLIAFEAVFSLHDNYCLAWPCLICDNLEMVTDPSAVLPTNGDWTRIPLMNLMKQGPPAKSQPSLRLLGSFGNGCLINRSMVDQHAEARAFLLKVAQEFAKGMNLQLENATILQTTLLAQLAVMGRKPLKLCQMAGHRPWINKYMMKHGQFTHEAMDVFFQRSAKGYHKACFCRQGHTATT